MHETKILFKEKTIFFHMKVKHIYNILKKILKVYLETHETLLAIKFWSLKNSNIIFTYFFIHL